MLDENDPLEDDFRTELQGMHAKSIVKRVEGFHNLALIEHWRARHKRDASHDGVHLDPAFAHPAITRPADQAATPSEV